MLILSVATFPLSPPLTAFIKLLNGVAPVGIRTDEPKKCDFYSICDYFKSF